MGRKRRFGISIPEELAIELDELVRTLGTNRSAIIRKAIEEFINDQKHYLYPHRCRGLMIVLGKPDRNKLFLVLESFKDIIHSFDHVHLGKECIEVLYINGSSERVKHLHSELMRIPGCIARYVCLCGIGKSKPK